MTGGKGAPTKQRTSTKTGDEKKQRKNFSVEIIFSSIPYSIFSGWKAEMYVDKRKPNSSQCSVLQLAWSYPSGNAYGPCDETIFIDCSQNNLDKFKDVTDDKKLSLTAYMSYAINRLKSIIYKKTQDGGYGKVDVKIIAIHPCQKCLFALSALLGRKLSDSGVYSTYVSNILKLDEYRYTFRWIQKEGWEFNVQYCAIFDAYKSVLEDTKGDDERIKELEELKKKYKDGDKDIPYNGTTVDYDFIEDEYERLTDPSEEQLRENVKAMRKQKEEVEKSAARENYVIDQALKEQKPYEMANIEIENLRNSSPKYKNKSKQELKELLQKRGLIDTQHIKVTNEGASGLQKALGIDTQEHQHAEVYMIDGVRMDVWSIENRRKEIQERVDIANRNYELAQKALKDKEMAFVNGVLDALQLVATIGSIAFPPLALIDVSITVSRWIGGDDCTTQDHIINGVGIAVDIAGLIPFFGTAAKVSKKIGSLAQKGATQVAAKKVKQNVLKSLHEELAKTAASTADNAASTTSSLWRSTLDELKSFHKTIANSKETISDVASFYANAYTGVMGIGYNGLSMVRNFSSDVKFDPKQVEKKRKEVEKQINKKPKWSHVKDKTQQLDANEEYQQATKDLEAAQKANDQDAIQSAKRRQAAAESLYASQMEIDVYENQDIQKDIKNAQSNLDEAKRQEAAAKKYSDQAHANATASYFSSDADLAYYEAKANTYAAEQALQDSTDKDYELAMARANAQMATQDIQYEKDIYSSKDDKKKSSKKK